MTNGDFAFFTFRYSASSSSTLLPWVRYVDDPNDRPYRRKAFYAVKQVIVVQLSVIIQIFSCKRATA